MIYYTIGNDFFHMILSGGYINIKYSSIYLFKIDDDGFLHIKGDAGEPGWEITSDGSLRIIGVDLV